MSDAFLGGAIENGEVRFFSVSALTKAAPESGGCFRKYFYRYVMRLSDKESNAESKASGDKLHDELARYQQTGDMALSSLAMKGLHMVPPPGPGLVVKLKFHAISGKTITSPLTAAGIPVVGELDCAHDRGINYGIDDVTERHDPPGTLEVIDWKWKSNTTNRQGLSIVITPDELVREIQMAGYGIVMGKLVKPQHIRLSHGIFPVRGGAPRKVTKLHVVDDCARTWEYVEGVARTCRDVARETVAEKIPANLRVCETYGGCPYRENCRAYKDNSLSTTLGIDMGLIDQLQQQFGTLPATTAPAPQAATPAALAAEEAALRAQQPQQQAQAAMAPVAPVQTPPPAPPPQPMQVHPLKALWDKICSYGRGYPQLGGAAAQAFAAACGLQLPAGGGYAGAGELAALPLFNPAQIEQLAGELAAGPPPPAHVPPAPLPTPPAAPNPLLPPGAPPSMPNLATAGEPATQSATTETPKRGRGRPKKAPDASASAPTSAAVTSAASVPAAAPAAVGPGAGADAEGLLGLEVYVDCLPLGSDFKLLNPYVDAINNALAKRYCVDAKGQPTIQDIRCAPKDGPLGYNGWKGAPREMVFASPPPAGAWYLDTRGNEIAELVAVALMEYCGQHGHLFVRGVR